MVSYVLGWLGLCAVAIANGVVRERTYGRRLSEPAAHRLSTLTGIVATTLAAYGLIRLYPIASAALAWRIGATWLGMTVTFEFAFGRFVAGHSWRRLLADYDLFAGRVWTLFLLWLLVLPWLLFRAGAGDG